MLKKFINYLILFFIISFSDLKPSDFYGVCSIQGKRKYQEDRWHIELNDSDLLASNHHLYFGIFDGHNGHSVAKYLESFLYKYIINKYKAKENRLSDSIEKAYIKIDKEVIARGMDSGSTAITCFLQNGFLYTANVGDSRAILSENGRVLELSIDQKPDRPDEIQRIEKAGGKVIPYNGAWLLQGFLDKDKFLNMSRSIGDRCFKPYNIAIPEITKFKLTENSEFVIMASDGFWDIVNNQEAISYVHSRFQQDEFNLQKIALELVQVAYANGSEDNITVIIVGLNLNKIKAKVALSIISHANKLLNCENEQIANKSQRNSIDQLRSNESYYNNVNPSYNKNAKDKGSIEEINENSEHNVFNFIFNNKYKVMFCLCYAYCAWKYLRKFK